MKKIRAGTVTAIFLLLFQIFLFSGNAQDHKPKAAPLNPEFLKYQEDVRLGKHQRFSSDGHRLGAIPTTVNLSHVKGTIDPSVVMSYASTYDLRTQGKLTSVKNQGSCGSCWAHGTMASLESYLMPSQNNNFSEQHLNANHGYDYAECDGGNAWMSAAYLLRWDGPLSETDVPYPYSSEINYSLQKHVQQVIFLPTRSSKLDNDTVKYFITTYGAVQCAYYDDDSCHNSTYKSYYYSGGTGSNHIVAVVGWDDNFSTSKFKTAPAGNGAFIAKNSWGTSFGLSGYFYISYYDTSLGYFTSFNNAESTSNYSKVYQYDTLGWVNDYGYANKIGWGANIFTAQETTQIKAVGFYLNDSNAQYQIYVYKGVTAGQPRTGTLSATKSGSKSYPGFYTVALDSAVSVSSGQRFSVVIKYTNSSYLYPVAVECPTSGYSSNASASSGQSYLSSDGSTWQDMTGIATNTNICIKAYTGSGSSGGTPTISLSQKTLNFTAITGASDTGTQTIRISNSGSGTLTWTTSKSGDSSWFSCSPSSGTNSRVISIAINPSGKSVGTYTGYLTITASGATNSPQTVTLNLTVKTPSQAQYPFGDFATPTNGSTVNSSIPVTGWALDDVGIANVKIYNSSTYVGDAIFIEGARPDVQAAYPTYPNSHKAGWGYMLLTNFLPGGGNGTYTLVAKATDKEGRVTTLGSKTIYCDNLHAVKPFGAIDTPTQGGTASGKEYVNFGWVLSPYPTYIPTNGSTIYVYVDGVSKGNAHYNNYRSDIADLFPSCYNSVGAGGYMYLDTTPYTDGIHTIQWIATSSSGQNDGIGSRYFTIQNSSSRVPETKTAATQALPVYQSLDDLADIPVDQTEKLQFKKGHPETDSVAPEQAEQNDAERASLVTIREDERLELNLKEDGNANDLHVAGYHLIGNRLEPLPIGSTLDGEKGIYYWQPSAGFVGNYRLIFVTFDASGPISQKNVHIKIIPKF
ncbi:MAG: lectin like domain-containing protein [Candidatus Omnitrophota bacterium]